MGSRAKEEGHGGESCSYNGGWEADKVGKSQSPDMVSKAKEIPYGYVFPWLQKTATWAEDRFV